MQRRVVQTVMAVGMLTLFCGCGRDATPAVLAIGMRNASQVDLSSAFIQYGAVNVGIGALADHAEKSNPHVAEPVPDSATVCFRTPDGLDRTRVVEVKTLVPAGFAGAILFTITEDLSVTVALTPRP